MPLFRVPQSLVLHVFSVSSVFPKSFTDLQHKPLLVDLTVEEGQRLKVIYGSSVGFHVIDVDSGNPYDIYIPSHVSDDRPSGGSSPLPYPDSKGL